MLEKYLSMMLLLGAASLVGINSVHQPIEVVAQPNVLEPTETNISGSGYVSRVWVYASSDGKACVASVDLLQSTGRQVDLLTRDENVCDLFSKVIIEIPKHSLTFEGMQVDNSVLPPGFRETLSLRNVTDLYQVDNIYLDALVDLAPLPIN